MANEPKKQGVRVFPLAALDAPAAQPTHRTDGGDQVAEPAAKDAVPAVEVREIHDAQRAPAPVVTGEVLPAPGERAGEDDKDEDGADTEVYDALLANLDKIDSGNPPFGPLQLPMLASRSSRKQTREEKAGAAEDKPRPQSIAEDAATWPSGPLVGRDEITPLDVERLVRAILTDSEIMEHATMPGLTRKRMVEAGERAGITRRRMGFFVAHLMVWFDKAGVMKPESAKEPDAWDRPRPLTTDDKEAIRRLLKRQSLPTKDEVEAVKEQGLGNGYI
jgi:hypothetical protein